MQSFAFQDAGLNSQRASKRRGGCSGRRVDHETDYHRRTRTMVEGLIDNHRRRTVRAEKKRRREDSPVCRVLASTSGVAEASSGKGVAVEARADRHPVLKLIELKWPQPQSVCRNGRWLVGTSGCARHRLASSRIPRATFPSVTRDEPTSIDTSSFLACARRNQGGTLILSC
ncbi:hypothetical protein VTI28DRAFT_9867 [Corynascus sepedonium]